MVVRPPYHRRRETAPPQRPQSDRPATEQAVELLFDRIANSEDTLMYCTPHGIARFAALAMCFLLGSVDVPAATAQSTSLRAQLIEQENQQPGATDWQLTRVRADAGDFRSPWIEGYCSRQSVAAGETLEIMVSTDPPQPFQIEIFRMGYYGGLGARLMQVLGPLEGKVQAVPTPGEKNLHECQWEPTARDDSR